MSRTAELILKLTDQTSGPAGQIISKLNALDSVLNGLDPATGKPARNVNVLTREFARLESAVHRVGAGLTLPAGALTVWGSKVVYEMEDVLNEIEGRTFGKGSTITLETGVKLDRKTFRQSVLDEVDILNRDTPLTGTAILDAWNQLVQAGLDYDQIRGVLPAALDFSIAGNLEPNLAVDQITNIATAMRLPMETTKQAQESMRYLADVIGYSANETNADIAQMAESFKYAAPAAAALGIDTEQLASMFVIMAQNGIKASEAGVAVRSMLVRMVRPTELAVGALAKYGIDFSEYLTGAKETTPADIVTMLQAAGINATPVTQAIGEILAKGLGPAQLREELTSAIVNGTGGGTAVDRGLISSVLNEALFGNGDNLDVERLITDMQAAGIATADFFRIFDVRQGARILGLFGDDVSRWVDDIGQNSPGFAQALRETRMQGIVGAVNRFDAAMIELFQSVAESGVLDAATKAIEGIAGLITQLGDVDPKILEYGAYAIGLIAILAPVGLALSGLAALFTILLSPLRLFASALSGLATLLFGKAAVAEALAAGAGGAAGGGLLGLLLRGTGIGAAVGFAMTPTEVNAGEDKWLASDAGKAQMDWYGKSAMARPRGPTRRSGRKRPPAEIDPLSDLVGTVDLLGRALWDDFVSNANGAEKGAQAGQELGQGVQNGIGAATPGVVGQILQMLEQAQAAVGTGIHVPVTVNGKITVPNPMAADVPGGGGAPSLYKPSSVPVAAPAGGSGKTAMVQHNTFNLKGDPKDNARQVSRVLDSQLQRSRGLSMDGRLEYG